MENEDRDEIRRISEVKSDQKVEFGVYLAEHEGDETRVLLPQKQVPADAKLGDEIEVFLYKDSKDRIIATTNQPKLTLGGLAVLEVAEIGKNRCVPGLGTGKRPVSSI